MPRQRRSPRSYARRSPQREPYDLVLIVCEGAKTEPTYFNGLCLAERLSTTNIRVTSAGASDPMSIVLFAENEMAQAVDKYDRAFCVFDRDGHANYDAAIARIASSPDGKSGKLRAITSWPCFELWILLHFRYSTAPFNRAGNKSSGDLAVSELLKFFPTYTKGHKTIFEECVARMRNAIENAKRLRKFNEMHNSLNPSTKVHTLVEYLTSIKKRT